MPAPACRLCRDTVYEGEGPVGGDGRPIVDWDVHIWCYHTKLAIDLCAEAMRVRRSKGLPTPTSPVFVDPNKPSN